MCSRTELWQHLQEVVTLRFTSRSYSGIGWSGSGVGIVRVSLPQKDVLIFDESGWWKQEGGREMRFTNVFRWSLLEDGLRLEHLRYGIDNPVFLFDIVLDEKDVWREVSPHPCRDDCY